MKKNKNLMTDDELFKPLDDMKIPEPSPLLQESFRQKLSQIAINESAHSNNRHLTIYLKTAIVAAIFVIGWILGSISNRQDAELLRQVQNQLDNNNKILALTLLQQSSISDQLYAANVSYSLKSIDNQIIAALIKTLETDSDPNVKIKCAEALAVHLSPDTINGVFGKALEYQNEPFIQLMLISYIRSIGNAESHRIINNFIASEKADDFVRSEVKRSINL